MLTILGDREERFCDGISRRGFLRIGALGMGGAALPQLLQAEAIGSGGRRQKSVIMIFLAGGPPHQDMFDLKMDAPSEIRGEFTPISTNVPGIQICELFPRLARIMDKLAIIRSVVGAHGGHDALQCFTGRSPQNAPPGGWPSIGSVMTRLQGPANAATPPFIGLSPKTAHRPWGDPGQAGFLGAGCAAFQPNGGGSGDLVLNGITLERLRDRESLLGSFDRFRRAAELSPAMEGLDAFTQQAFGVLTSSRMAEAMDLEKEDQGLRDRYGRGSDKLQADGAWKLLDQFLMARRLVEAGARCVTLAFSRWDWHGNNFGRAREDFPMLDQGVSALVEDLHARGLDQDVSVVVWGEFGRTPTINKDGGRDHWPQVSCALLAGGGMRTGQVIGATDRLGGEAVERPVDFQEVFATLYHNVGIDVKNATVTDLSGRPRFLVDQEFSPMPELV
ncbi:MAG TPA: DUF1501 domain-containing protein [Verrucomicrobiales bacterium]|nr:DUF1501 domain-containing protein [Verrucomicrobiales bacterium]